MSTMFTKRREAVASLLGPDACLLVASNNHVSRNIHHTYSFRQDSYFWYLSGFNESDSIVLIKTDNTGNLSSYMFVPPKDEHSELWDGYRAGPQGAKNDYGFDHGFNNFDADKTIPGLLAGANKVFSLIGYKEDFSQRVSSWVKEARLKDRHTAAIEHLDAGPLLSSLRRVKSDSEIEIMRKGCEISAQAHKSAMQFVAPDMNEQSLEAYYLYKFAEHGSRFPAYTPIVAGGEHACILHYVENDQILKDGDLVLVDAGGEYQYYASDITRTYPVNGKFSAEQLAIYNIVLQAQQEAIAAMKAGNHIMQPQEISERVITEGLIDLGLLTGSAEDLIAEGAHKKFYMHKVGHWIGLDTHDVGAYSDGSNFTQYEPGMVQTIEPGIYISSKSDVDDKWKGIGVRIEDNILVTVDGNENLTASAPVDPEEIEAVMAG